MEKPKTYMLRLYPDRAADKILINYLKSENNIQQYLRRLIEQDIRKENIEITIHRAVKETFYNIFKDKEIRVLSGGSISFSGDEVEVPETFTFNTEEKKQSDIPQFKEEIPETEIQNPDSEVEENEEQEESVEQITQDALAFLAGLE